MLHLKPCTSANKKVQAILQDLSGSSPGQAALSEAQPWLQQRKLQAAALQLQRWLPPLDHLVAPAMKLQALLQGPLQDCRLG